MPTRTPLTRARMQVTALDLLVDGLAGRFAAADAR